MAKRSDKPVLEARALTRSYDERSESRALGTRPERDRTAEQVTQDVAQRTRTVPMVLCRTGEAGEAKEVAS